MKLFCSHCGHEIEEARDDMENTTCPECDEGIMLSEEEIVMDERILTLEDLAAGEFEGDIDDDLDFELMGDPDEDEEDIF